MQGTQHQGGLQVCPVYLQFWWNARVALFSFGAMLPALPSRPKVTFVSLFTFGPLVASGSVVAIVPMVS